LTTIGFPAELGQLADEICPFSTTFPNNSYLAAKIAMEEAVLKAARNGVPAVVLNPTAFFGPFDSKPTSGTQIIMIAKRKMPGYIDGPTNVIDVRDVAIAHINAAERGRIGERYIVGNWNTTQKALNELIAKVAGVPAPKVPVPFSVARFGLKLVDWASRTLLHKKTTHPGFLCRSVQTFSTLRLFQGIGGIDLSPESYRAGYTGIVTLVSG
jgi:dihydroflavonol-4-reductase